MLLSEELSRSRPWESKSGLGLQASSDSGAGVLVGVVDRMTPADKSLKSDSCGKYTVGQDEQMSLSTLQQAHHVLRFW